jgi:hypothetical protein
MSFPLGHELVRDDRSLRIEVRAAAWEATEIVIRAQYAFKGSRPTSRVVSFPTVEKEDHQDRPGLSLDIRRSEQEAADSYPMTRQAAMMTVEERKDHNDG